MYMRDRSNIITATSCKPLLKTDSLIVWDVSNQWACCIKTLLEWQVSVNCIHMHLIWRKHVTLTSVPSFPPRCLCVVCFILGDSPASESCISTFRNTFHRRISILSAYEDGTECSETSAHRIQTPRNYPEESIPNSEYGESLKSGSTYTLFHTTKFKPAPRK
jgi:hypothetical protein